MKILIIPIFFALFIFSCKDSNTSKEIALETSNSRPYSIEWFVEGLNNPWGMTWLPDGSLLITEKEGQIIHYKNGKKQEIGNAPKIKEQGQGGLMDVEIHPNYVDNGWIYFTLSSDEGGGSGANTKLIRARLKGNGLIDIETLYKAVPNTPEGQHFGSRIAFDDNGYVFFSIGDRGKRDENPQNIKRDGGKIYRLNDDGSIPTDNPFVNTSGAKTAIFSYGHRNPQGLAKHPTTGDIWEHEHGPKGGDEVNIIKKGHNYGWPVITYGVNYSGTPITDKRSKEGMEQPVHYWVPSIAPCGMDFVTGNKYPDWKGHLVVGSLKFGYVELLRLDGNKVVEREKIAEDIGRVRNVKMGPDGFLYVAIEGRGIARLIPTK